MKINCYEYKQKEKILIQIELDNFDIVEHFFTY